MARLRFLEQLGDTTLRSDCQLHILAFQGQVNQENTPQLGVGMFSHGQAKLALRKQRSPPIAERIVGKAKTETLLNRSIHSNKEADRTYSL